MTSASGATQVVNRVPKGSHKIRLTTKSWKHIDGRKGLKVLLTAASDGGRDVLNLLYRAEFRDVQYSVGRDKREPVIVLLREAKNAAKGNDFRKGDAVSPKYFYVAVHLSIS